jgi:phage tail sheath protein FI
MGIYISPGVYSKEKDLSTLVPAISTTTGALVGYSVKGSTSVRLITTQQQFIAEYGEPVPGNYFHYSALAFLTKGIQLYCRRVINGALYPGMHVMTDEASGDSEAFSIGQSTPTYFVDSDFADELFSIFAKDPGVWGENISITITNIKDGTEEVVTDQYTFVINVYFTDSEGNTTLVEKWKVSKKNKIDGNGKQLYLESVINDASDYIVVADNTNRADTEVPKGNTTAVSLGGGSDGSIPTANQIAGVQASGSGWYSFYNPANYDIRILIGGCFTSSHTTDDVKTIQDAIKAVAEYRKDCMGILDIPYDEIDSIDEMLTYRNTTQAYDSSYTALYAGWVKINDPYNDRVLEVPASGYIAAQFAYNDYVGEPWTAPAGHNRGKLDVLGIVEDDPFTQGEMDSLCAVGINPIQFFRGRGTTIFDQLTQQKKTSALSQINVRRLLIVMEKAISIALEDFLFEPNNELTRFRVKAVCDEYLSMLASKGAFQVEAGDEGFLVVCDTTNNTPTVIDRTELHVDIFVKPIRVARIIQLQTIITTTGASFTELIAKGVMF